MVSKAPTNGRQPARRARVAAVSAVGVLLVLCVGFAGLFNTQRGAQFALSAAQSLSNGAVQTQDVDGTLNGPLNIGHLTLTLTNQKIELSDVHLDWRPVSLLSGRLHITSLKIGKLGVVGKISQTKDATALPERITLPIKLQIDRVQVDGGDIAWGPMSVIKLGGFAFNLDFDGQRYLLNLERFSARSQTGANTFNGAFNGKATLAATKPYALNASLVSDSSAVVDQRNIGANGHIDLQGSLAEIRAAIELHVDRTSVSGNAVLRPFSDNLLGATHIKTRQLNLAELTTGLPATSLNIDLNADEKGAGTFTLNNADAGLINDGKLPLDKLDIDFTQPHAQFNIDRISANLGTARRPAGRIKGSGQYAKGALMLMLKTDALDLQKVDQRVRATRLAGTIDMRHADGRQTLTLALSEPLKKNPLTLNAHAVIADETIAVDRLQLRAGGSAIDAAAHISLGGRQQFDANGTVRSFRLRDLGDFSQTASAQLPDLLVNGDFSIRGARQPGLEADASFRIDNSRLAATPLTGEGKVQLRANSLIVSKLLLRAGANSVTAQGKLAERDSRITFALAAPSLEQLGNGFAGAMQISGEVRGSVQRPRIVAEWSGTRIHAPGKMQIDSTQGKADVVLDRNTAALITSADVSASANGLHADMQQLGSVNAQIRMGAQANAPLAITARATGIDSRQLRAQSFGLDVTGTTAQHSLTATLAEREQNWKLIANGGMDLQRAPRWQGTLDTLNADGRFNARLAAPAALLASQKLVQLDRFQLNADNVLLSIEQFVRNGDSMSTRGRFEHLQVGKLLPYLQSQPSIAADLRLGGEWNLKLDNNLGGTFAVRRESGDVIMLGNAPVALGLGTLTASADVSDGRVALKLQAEGKQLGRIGVNLNTTIGGNGSRFSIAPNAPLAGTAQINTPTLGWLGPLVSQTLVTEGSLQGDVTLNGTFGQPRFAGQIAADNLRLLFTDTGIDLKQGTMRSEFQGDRLIVKRLDFQNGGTLAISGPVSLTGQQLALELAIKASHYKLLDRSDRKLVVSGDSTVGWREGKLKADGKFTADSGMVDIGTADTPELSDDVVIVGQSARQGTKTAIALDLNLNLGNGIRLRGRGLDALLVGQIRLLATAGDTLRAQGTLRVASGTFKAYGRELTIDRGLLRFNGPLNNPTLDIQAMRKGQEVEAGVSVGGNVLAPRITLVSDPVVADAEKLSWLVLGRGLSSAGGGDIGALQSAASSLLAQGAASGLSSQLATAFGLDDFSVGTSDTSLQERIVTLGKKISSRLYVSYQQGLESASSVLLLRYTLTKSITVEAEAGTRSALSMFYNFAFD